MAYDIWPVIHTERKALAADLEGLTDAQWQTRSQCADWSVQDVVAHMLATSHMSGAKFFPKFVGAGFNFEKLQSKGIEQNRGTSPADMMNNFAAQLDSKGRPPGPPMTMLGEVIIHSDDIRRPLGIAHEYPTEVLTQLGTFFSNSSPIIHGKERVAGLHLKATDTEWEHGSGPTVEGPMLPLLLAITGRKSALTDLSGDGVDTLRSR